MSEFDLIRSHFTWPAPAARATSVIRGVGDDAAIVRVPVGDELLVSVDTLISGVHFPVDTVPHAIGHKTLAVNLSDMAAMGATARWFTLALSLPQADPSWLTDFARGLRELADQHQVALIGGDTTRGPLSLTVQIMGTLPQGQALLRSGAQPGDVIAVSGYPGEAAAGLACLQGRLTLPPTAAAHCRQRLDYPTPRLSLGYSLHRHGAHSCLDVSDGLLSDPRHILQASDTAARLDSARLPLSPVLHSLPIETAQTLMLNGGDDYELLFTAAPGDFAAIHEEARDLGVPVTVIGEIVAQAPADPLLCLTTNWFKC
ncbi:MAG: thiamine-phosphate kinase [Thiolinea sp.]